MSVKGCSPPLSVCLANDKTYLFEPRTFHNYPELQIAAGTQTGMQVTQEGDVHITVANDGRCSVQLTPDTKLGTLVPVEVVHQPITVATSSALTR